MSTDDEKLRKYLLGAASEPDEAETGRRIIGDEAFCERLDHAESELVEDYLDDLLPESEARLFRENFLVTPDRNDLLNELKMIRAGVRTARPLGAPARQQKDRRIFSFFRKPLLVGFAALAVVITGFAIWYTTFRDGRTPLEVEYAAINRHDLTDVAKTSGMYTISIIPSNLRDDASTASHPSRNLTDTVAFRLALPVSEAEGAEMKVSIERSGKSAFRVQGRVFRNAFGSELRFLAPKSVLERGNYEVVVSSAAEPRAKTAYQLRIE